MLSVRLVTLALAYFTMASMAAPISISRREVPQEHSHEPFLTKVRSDLLLNNPQGLVDPVFGLLGAAAAKAGLGKSTDTDCLQQAMADQAFSNAKAAKDVGGMVNALLYRAIEKNTGKVGLASVACTSVKAVNPEIAAIAQHQDPASANAATVNKAITLELAKQIKSVGGDPLLALKAGTFAPGNVNDNTGAGNTCDDADDPAGCIFTKKLIVEDATAAEITAAVGGAQAAAPVKAEPAKGGKPAKAEAPVKADAAGNCPAPVTVTVTAAAAATEVATPVGGAADAAITSPPVAVAGNLQTFTEALGGVLPPVVTANGAKFDVEGNASFNNQKSAIVRSCDVQNNKCANASNGAGNAKTFSVQDCVAQQTKCLAAAGN